MSLPARRLSFLYGALFFELGVNLPFFPLWLHDQSLTPEAIGIVLAAPLLTRIVANPAIGALADRGGRMTWLLFACAVAVTVGIGMLALARGFWPILLLVIAIGFAQGPLIALTDAVTLGRLDHLPDGAHRYGRLRLWGSAGFALANISAGWLLDWLPASSIIGMLLVSALATALAALLVSRTATPERPQAPTEGIAGPGRPDLLALTIAGAALVQASHAAIYGFSSLHWQQIGFSGAATGALWASGIAGEMLFFCFVGYMIRGPVGAAGLLVASAAVAALRWTGMAFDPNFAGLIVLQLAHGVSFGATHLCSVFLLARFAPPTLQAQAQTWLAAGWAGAMALLTSLAGALYTTWGEGVYLLMAATAVLGLCLLLPVAVALARTSPFRGGATSVA